MEKDEHMERDKREQSPHEEALDFCSLFCYYGRKGETGERRREALTACVVFWHQFNHTRCYSRASWTAASLSLSPHLFSPISLSEPEV